MGRVRVTIEGYGVVKVKRPERLNRGTFADAIGEAVSKTMELLVSPPVSFHPVLGLSRPDFGFSEREVIVKKNYLPGHRHFYKIASFGNTEYVAFQCSCGSSRLIHRKNFIGGA